MIVSVIDPVVGDLVTPDVYACRLADRRGVRGVAPMLMSDIPPDQAFRSPVDGSVITSRRELAEHNARNGVVDVGNDAAFKNPKPRDVKPQGIKQDLIDVWNGRGMSR